MPAFDKSYDPGRHVIILAGNIITGYADGSFIRVARQTDTFSSKAGADGEVARIRSRDKRGLITLTLLGTSRGNDYLSAAHRLDEASGQGVYPFSMQDLNGRSLCDAPNAWARKVAELERGKELPDIQWEIECDVLNLFVGGIG